MNIDAEALHRAERTLSVVYGHSDYGRQLSALEVDRSAFDALLQRRVGVVRSQYRNEWKAMDPRLEPALNVLFMHFFLVGLVAGGHRVREIT